MFRYICKSFHSFLTTSEPHKSNILRLQQFSSSCVTQHSFPVSYLINQLGFSLEKAVVASKSLNFENGDKPDAVLSFFKNQGFTHTQIQKLITTNPRILLCKSEKNLLPKIEFFRYKGFSSTDLAKMITFNVRILRRSLNGYIIPTFNSLRDLVGTEEDVIVMLKGDSRLFNYAESRVKPNIEILRGAGVPRSSIDSLLRIRTRLFCFGTEKLKEAIVELEEMGLDPKRWNYILALYVLTVTPRLKLSEKMEAYKSWGCSEDEVRASFKIQPMIMTLSVEKINAVMRFCVNEMGWEPSEVVVRRYDLLTWSLNKRIMPRWAVYQELVSKRLVEKEGELIVMFKMREVLFLQKYINCFENDAPLLLKVYREKLESLK